jgi:hypothetical protein
LWLKHYYAILSRNAEVNIYLKGEGLPHDLIVSTVGLNIGGIEDANVKLVF